VDDVTSELGLTSYLKKLKKKKNMYRDLTFPSVVSVHTEITLHIIQYSVCNVSRITALHNKLTYHHNIQ
jgi:hypothetical protein